MTGFFLLYCVIVENSDRLVSLRTLDISNNALEKLDNKTHGILDDCLSLERVNLSGNHISFVTRKTFPSSPYIPYRLQEIDLSYNTMPVATLELTAGTEKVQKLNLSHNALNEIRPGVLGKLKSIETLDLSWNQLTEINDLSSQNLTNLIVTGNKITEMNLKNLTKLKMLDIQSNRFTEYPKNFLEHTRAGAKILFDGNPLTCDCKTLALRRQLVDLKSEKEKEKLDVKCKNPDYLIGKTLSNIPEVELICPLNFHHDDEETELTPDLRFTKFEFKNGKAFISWFVTSRSDISDFYLVVEDNSTSHTVLYEKLIAYNTRSIFMSPNDVQLKSPLPNEIRFCLLAVDSTGSVGDPFPQQCKAYPVSSVMKFLSSQGVSQRWSYLYISFFFIMLWHLE